MEASGYIRAVVRGWWIVLAAVIAGVLIAAAATAAVQPVYQSSVKFFATAQTTEKQTALQADAVVRERIDSYPVLLTGSPFIGQISGALKLPADQVAKSINASDDSNTRTVSADVRDSDPARAQAIAAQIAADFPKAVSDLDGDGTADRPTPTLTVVSGPTPATAPISPRWSLNLALGLLVGLIAGIALAIARRRADRSLHSAQQLFGDPALPLLAATPRDRGAAPGHGHGVLPDSPLAEAMRGLRTAIQFNPAARSLGVIAVASPRAGDGKTMTALHLARAFAEADKRVLLVEANLRHPRLAEALKLPRTPGLGAVLRQESGLAEAITAAVVPNLDVLAAGPVPARPAELLAGGALEELFGRARQDYDVVIVDTAPLESCTDGTVVAALADSTIVVAAYGRTTPEQLNAALQQLATVHARVIGTTFNLVPARDARRLKDVGRKGAGKAGGRAATRAAHKAAPGQHAAPPVPAGHASEAGRAVAAGRPAPAEAEGPDTDPAPAAQRADLS